MDDHQFVDQIADDANARLGSSDSTARFRESATTESGYPTLDLVDTADGDRLIGNVTATLLSSILRTNQFRSFMRALILSHGLGEQKIAA